MDFVIAPQTSRRPANPDDLNGYLTRLSGVSPNLFTPPEVSTSEHFPKDDKWQLADHAITRGEFMRKPQLRPTFFAEDGFYQITTRENMAAGYPVGILTCDGRGMMQDRVDALQNANIFEQHTYCHIVGRAQLWSESPTLLGARSNFSVFRTMEDGATALFAIGKYLDRIEIDAAGIRFKERRVVLDSRRIDVLLVMPL